MQWSTMLAENVTISLNKVVEKMGIIWEQCVSLDLPQQYFILLGACYYIKLMAINLISLIITHKLLFIVSKILFNGVADIKQP